MGAVEPIPPLPPPGTSVGGPITVSLPTFTVIGGIEAFPGGLVNSPPQIISLPGALTISGGSTLNSLANADVAQGPGPGTVLVTGAGSTWSVADGHGDFSLWVGKEGPGVGTLTISDFGLVTEPQSMTDTFSGDTNVGYDPGAVGVLKVNSGGKLEGRGLLVGSQGTGTLTISGGTVELQQITVIGRFPGGNGTINVNSGGTLTVGPILSYNFENGSNPNGPFVGGLIVGDGINGGGTGTLNINEGTVLVENPDGTVVGKKCGRHRHRQR